MDNNSNDAISQGTGKYYHNNGNDKVEKEDGVTIVFAGIFSEDDNLQDILDTTDPTINHKQEDETDMTNNVNPPVLLDAIIGSKLDSPGIQLEEHEDIITTMVAYLGNQQNS